MPDEPVLAVGLVINGSTLNFTILTLARTPIAA